MTLRIEACSSAGYPASETTPTKKECKITNVSTKAFRSAMEPTGSPVLLAKSPEINRDTLFERLRTSPLSEVLDEHPHLKMTPLLYDTLLEGIEEESPTKSWRWDIIEECIEKKVPTSDDQAKIMIKHAPLERLCALYDSLNKNDAISTTCFPGLLVNCDEDLCERARIIADGCAITTSPSDKDYIFTQVISNVSLTLMAEGANIKPALPVIEVLASKGYCFKLQSFPWSLEKLLTNCLEGTSENLWAYLREKGAIRPEEQFIIAFLFQNGSENFLYNTNETLSQERIRDLALKERWPVTSDAFRATPHTLIKTVVKIAYKQRRQIRSHNPNLGLSFYAWALKNNFPFEHNAVLMELIPSKHCPKTEKPTIIDRFFAYMVEHNIHIRSPVLEALLSHYPNLLLVLMERYKLTWLPHFAKRINIYSLRDFDLYRQLVEQLPQLDPCLMTSLFSHHPETPREFQLFEQGMDFLLQLDIPFDKAACLKEAITHRSIQQLHYLEAKGLLPEEPVTQDLTLQHAERSSEEKQIAEFQIKHKHYSLTLDNFNTSKSNPSLQEAFFNRLREVLEIRPNDEKGNSWLNEVMDLIGKFQSQCPYRTVMEWPDKITFIELLELFYTRRNSLLGISPTDVAKTIYYHKALSEDVFKELIRFIDYIPLCSYIFPKNWSITTYHAILAMLLKKTVPVMAIQAKVWALLLSFLFESVDDAEEYLDIYQSRYPHNKNAIQYACEFQPPPHGMAWDPKAWQKVVAKGEYARKWIRLIGNAHRVELALCGPLPLINSLIELDPIKQRINQEYEKTRAKTLPKASSLDEAQAAYHKQKENLILKQAEMKVCCNYLKWFILENLVLPNDTRPHWEKIQDAIPAHITRYRNEKGLQERPLNEHEFFHWLYRELTITPHCYNRVINRLIQFDWQAVSGEYSRYTAKALKAGLSSKDFLEAITIKSKKYEVLPDISFSGDKVDLGSALRFYKLPKDDIRQFFLGGLTGCCQNINGEARECVLHGAMSPYGGFYLIEYRNNIVAQSWAGLTTEGDLLFDSIEWNKRWSPEDIMKMYHGAAQEIVKTQPSVRRVLFGGGGNTPQNHTFPLLEKKQKYSPIIGFSSIGHDSIEQRYVLAEKSEDDTALPFGLYPGIDTYVKPGRVVRQPAMHHWQRHAFYSTHPNARQLLSHDSRNPLLEEGYYHMEGERKQGVGEFFLTVEAMEQIAKKIGLKDVIFASSTKMLKNALAQHKKNLSKGLLICYTEEVHSVPFFLQKHHKEIKAFTLDAEGNLSHEHPAIQIVTEIFPRTIWIIPEASMQKDFYSCGTITLKMLKTLKRMRATLFDSIDVNMHCIWKQWRYVLNMQRTPAELLKLSQKQIVSEKNAEPDKFNLVVPEEKLNEIASKKHGHTLSDYQKKYSVTFDGQRYNIAALRTKYKYAALLK